MEGKEPMIPEDSPSGELIGAVYLDPRMVYEFPIWLVDETNQIIDQHLDRQSTGEEERAILTVVKAACVKRMDAEGRE